MERVRSIDSWVAVDMPDPHSPQPGRHALAGCEMHLAPRELCPPAPLPYESCPTYGSAPDPGSALGNRKNAGGVISPIAGLVGTVLSFTIDLAKFGRAELKSRITKTPQ